MNTDVAVSQPLDRVAVFLASTVAMRYGGMTRAFLSRARLYANCGVTVQVLLTHHMAHEDAEEAALRRAWSLPESVQFRYFWREAAPGGGGAPIDPLALAEHEPGLESEDRSRAKDRLVHFYDDGVLVKTKVFNEDRLVHINRRDEAGRVDSREHFDPVGRLVRRDELNPETGERILRRWFDRSGTCWLTTWFDAKDQQQRTVRHTPDGAEFDHFSQCLAEWVDEVLADCRRPVVFADKRDLDPALLAVSHPSARRVAVMHTAHQRKPYGSTEQTKTSWLPLLEHSEKVDAVVALTHRQADDIAARHDVTNVTVIPHRVGDPEIAEPERESCKLVAVGRLVEQKRLEDAIGAFAIAAEQVPAARFDIYGEGPLLSQLRSLATELGVADRVSFRGQTDRPLDVLASATASVLSSRYEGWGLVLTESMSVGTPAIAYDINYGPDEIIRHEVDGLLVPPGDTDALAAAMVRMLNDPDYAAASGRRAREVTERFSHQRWRDNWTELFNQLAGTDIRPAVATTADDRQDTSLPRSTRIKSSPRVLAHAVLARSPRRVRKRIRKATRWARANSRRIASSQQAARGRLAPRLRRAGAEFADTAPTPLLPVGRAVERVADLLDQPHDTPEPPGDSARTTA